MTQPALRMAQIDKSFAGVAAVRAARLEAFSGEAMALMGANGAGKSTLMNILGGVVEADGGTIELGGAGVDIHSPRQAAAAGIAFVHQELTMFPTMSVAENIFIDDLPAAGGLIARRRMAEETKRLLARLGSTIAPATIVEQLSIGDRQLVEIARALRHRARVVIFDEPTSSLTLPERQRLFEVIRGLKAEGVAVIYITHFLDEIFAVCERVTVMRNGETVWESAMGEVTPAQVVQQMLGSSEAGGRVRPVTASARPPMLSVEGLSRAGVLHDVSFALRPGEVVGLWGLLGSGRTELLRCLVGLDKADKGQLLWGEDGTAAPITPEVLRYRVGLVTEDRRGEGLHLPLSVAQNISLPNLRRLLGPLRLVSAGKEASLADEMIGRLKIKVASRQQAVATLSGGNQQKVVFAKWLATDPKLLLLDEPTRGLDVSAKSEILRLVADLAAQGCACLLVSSELEELMRVCDRYLVMSRGRLVQELPGDAPAGALMDAIAMGTATEAA